MESVTVDKQDDWIEATDLVELIGQVREMLQLVFGLCIMKVVCHGQVITV